MSRAVQKKQKLPPFVALTWEVLNSAAYKELPPSAAKALPFFLGKDGRAVRKQGGDYTGTFEFSYGEAEAMGFATRTFARAITDLVAHGFIEMAGYGGLRGNCKSFNRFQLSGRWRNYGTALFRDVPRYPNEPNKKAA